MLFDITEEPERPIAYDEVIAKYNNLITQDKFPNAILLHGLKGSGKRFLAEYFIKQLLKNTITRYSNIKLHPDLLIIDEEEQKSKKKEITIDNSKKIKSLLALTPYEDSKQIILIDSADKLNISASNNLLKTLEESPKNAYFILISHNKNNLLDTVLSRVQQVKLPRLKKSDTIAILEKHKIENIETLAKIFPHQPGKILEFSTKNSLDMLHELEKILANDNYALHNFSKKFSFKDNLELFEDFVIIIIYLIRERYDINNKKLIKNYQNFIKNFLEDSQKTISLNLDTVNFTLNYLRALKKI